MILAFDVKVNREAKAYAEKLGVKIFTADIIYHLQVSAEIDSSEKDSFAVPALSCCLVNL